MGKKRAEEIRDIMISGERFRTVNLMEYVEKYSHIPLVKVQDRENILIIEPTLPNGLYMPSILQLTKAGKTMITTKKDEPTSLKDYVDVGNYTGVHQAYQELITWTRKKIGYLELISIVASDYVHAQFKLTVKAVQFTDKTLLTTLNIPYNGEIGYAVADTIKVEVQSDDGTSITTACVIKGQEEV
jgi:DNA-binding LacI/PurR family transcriptional regulator